MKTFSFLDIQQMGITPAQCNEWVNEIILHKREAFLPPKIHMNLDGNIFCNVMPGLVAYSGRLWGGVKIVTRYPKRVPALDSKLLLFDAENGDFLALMDADWITAMRTGAVAAHSVRLFGRKDYQTVGMIGLGNTARATMLCLADSAKSELRVKLLRYKDQAQRFTERFADYSNLHFTICNSAEEVVRGSDIVISCATYFEDDICRDDCFDEGVLVVPVHTRGFTNCDLFFDKVFADDTAHVSDFRYFSKFRSFAEVSDVVNGTKLGRETDRERILAYNIGISLHDIGFAARIYQMAENNLELFDKLENIVLHEPTDKFWV